MPNGAEQAKGIIEMLCQMVDGMAPKPFQLKASPFMERVGTALGLYITTKDEQERLVEGEDAASIILKKLKAKSEKEALKFDDLNEVWQFQYLLNEEEFKTLSDLRVKLVQASPSLVAPRAESASAASGAKRQTKQTASERPSKLFD